MCAKPKVAFYWCASCGGCEEAIVDLAEDLIGVAGAVDIVLWPVAMDFKKHDVEAMLDRSIVATFINGAVRSSEQHEMALLLRRKSQHVIAYGACAQLGGIPALANQFTREDIMRFNYDEAPTVENQAHTRPQAFTGLNGHRPRLPELHHVVRTLDQVIEVDYYLPGCPPPAKLTKAAIDALLAGNLPPKGAVLAPDAALCEQCPRKGTKPTDLHFSQFKRPHLVPLDRDTCFLAQSVVCMGPATRGGCEAACVCGNMPCTGCFGPTSRVRDQGAKMLSAVCSNLAAREPAEIDQALAGIPDPVGTFYRYGFARSLLRRRTDLANT